MIRFAGASKEGGIPTIGIGLTAEEVANLTAGRQVIATTEGLIGFAPLIIYLMYGETEEAIYKGVSAAHEAEGEAPPDPPATSVIELKKEDLN